MSDFDSNPFADPEAANPFADPSVQRAAASTKTTTPQDAEFNPFEDKNKTQTAPTPAPAPQPAVMQPTPEPPPAYTPSAQQKIPTDDLQKRQEELEKKAAELQRREHDLRNTQFNARSNNWPPLPAKCCVGPCFYHDIGIDIPIEFQRMVKLLYYEWMVHSVVLFFNVLGSLAYFIESDSNNSTDAGATFGLSILFFLLFAPCSFVCWFRPVYKAFRSDSSFNFFVFFFVFFFQCVAHIVQCLGIAGTGSVGWISGLSMIGKHAAAGAIMLVIGFLFTLLAVIDALFLIKVHRLYRSTGASFQKAQSEFATGVMKSEAAQSAATSAGQAAVRGATSEVMGGNKY